MAVIDEQQSNPVLSEGVDDTELLLPAQRGKKADPLKPADKTDE